MKKYLVLATVFMMSSYAQAATMTWYGSAGWKYSKASQNDGTSNSYSPAAGSQLLIKASERQEKSHLFRADLGATGGWDNVEWGIGVRTNGATNRLATPATGGVNSDWNSNNASDLGIGVNRAWFKYGNDWGFGDIGLVIGRQAPAFAVGAQQVFIDKDVNFDGLAQTWHWGSFGLNFAQYVLGGVDGSAAGTGDSSFIDSDAARFPGTPTGFSVLYAFQPTFKWKFSDEMNALFAVGYYRWSNTTGASYTNAVPNGGTAGFGSNTAAVVGNATGAFATRTSVENSAHFQVLTQWQFPFMIGVEAEYVRNKDQFYGAPKAAGGNDNFGPVRLKQDNTAFSLGAHYGQLKKAHDFQIGYAYHNKGQGSVIARYSDDLILPGYKAHAFWANYNIANNFHVGARLQFLDEIIGRDNTGFNNNKLMQTNYWEVSSGVKF